MGSYIIFDKKVLYFVLCVCEVPTFLNFNRNELTFYLLVFLPSFLSGQPQTLESHLLTNKLLLT